jgi:T4 gene Gp59 loader of gp41 DNA helicase C-term/T4 gene Gp59 loader of gp41 DNA helicase
MTGFEAYQLYISIKLHFTQPNYDYFEFNGKTKKITVSSFEARNDRSFFFKIGNKYSREKLIDLYVSNFVDNPDFWIGDFFDENSEEVYTQWQKKIEGLTYHFTEECRGLLEWCSDNNVKFNDLFRVKGTDHPIIVKMALQKVISLESFIILDSFLKFGERVDKRLDDVIWKELWFRACKYAPFISIDSGKCKSILRKLVQTEHKDVV